MRGGVGLGKYCYRVGVCCNAVQTVKTRWGFVEISSAVAAMGLQATLGGYGMGGVALGENKVQRRCTWRELSGYVFS